MNKYLHLGTLVAALSAGCTANFEFVNPASPLASAKPAESATKPAEPVKEAEPLQPREEFKGPYVCDKVDLKDSAYNVGTPAMPATYLVLKNATQCGLQMENSRIVYVDLDCNNTLDYLSEGEVMLSREEVVDDINIFDRLLQLGQKYVCKENRINYDDKH